MSNDKTESEFNSETTNFTKTAKFFADYLKVYKGIILGQHQETPTNSEENAPQAMTSLNEIEYTLNKLITLLEKQSGQPPSNDTSGWGQGAWGEGPFGE